MKTIVLEILQDNNGHYIYGSFFRRIKEKTNLTLVQVLDLFPRPAIRNLRLSDSILVLHLTSMTLTSGKLQVSLSSGKRQKKRLHPIHVHT